MVQGKKPDGPGGDPSIVIIKFDCRCKDQTRWVWCRRTTCRSSPSSSPRTCKVEGTARMHRWGGPTFFAHSPFYPQATNGRATNGNGAPSEEIQGKSWYYGPIRSRMDGATLSVFHLFDNSLFYSRGECDAIMDQKGQDGDFLVSINKFIYFYRFYKDIFLNITNVK